MRRPLTHLLLAGALAAGVAVAACSGQLGREPARVEPATNRTDGTVAARTLQPDDMVNLTLYFRAGEGAHAHLERVIREVAVGQDLPRRALELLLAGPGGDEANLDPALPVTTQIRALDIHGGLAHVVLSPEVIRDATTVGDSPANEALALAAVVNTLTEFPSVDRVLLEVQGQGIAAGEFWGGWGLPPVLVRDESLIGAPGGADRVPELGRFSAESQTTGSDDAGATEMTSVRVRDRLTHVRVVVELSDPATPEAGAKVPRVRARGSSEEIVLDISGVTAPEDVTGQRPLDLSDPAFHELGIAPSGSGTSIRLAVDGARDRRFWLHSMTGPTRIVLDVMK